ncbi:iron-sulfur cluster repair di-iron protein [Polaribacter gangjinensis]|uniref:Iron-sulfur cluster repair di-iron protein n=1 Tax=Polaribacter gangjinensis TaxID=574710 RepID=A0A2S7W9S9_9FLAO|nr:iron-sulfur cluster repair di-iron protein [Polaribacter gangjinensis]PQJ74388.1 iron-sulfur cluster repair di-iron protein [Polaribacter gangjinensis]
MTITSENTIGEVVTKNIKTADIFKKYGIDFCCGGGITIKKACEKHQIDYLQLQHELLQAEEGNHYSHQYDTWELDYLAAHIEHVHHKYVATNTPIIQQYAAKVAKVHGHHYQEVIKINDLFNEVAKELAAHMKKEELILFPFIKKLAIASKNNEKIRIPYFGTVNNPIKMMEEEHENAGEILKQIKELSNNYNPPKEACNTFRALYAKLEEFENDLHQHIHLENNILFPKAIVLEQKFGIH